MALSASEIVGVAAQDTPVEQAARQRAVDADVRQTGGARRGNLPADRALPG